MNQEYDLHDTKDWISRDIRAQYFAWFHPNKHDDSAMQHNCLSAHDWHSTQTFVLHNRAILIEIFLAAPSPSVSCQDLMLRRWLEKHEPNAKFLKYPIVDIKSPQKKLVYRKWAVKLNYIARHVAPNKLKPTSAAHNLEFLPV